MPTIIRALRALVPLLGYALSAVAQQAAPTLTDEEVLKLYDGLRVADVVDGMDRVGLRDVGLVDTRIQALWKDLEGFTHQMSGIALTVRYVPHNRIIPNPIPEDQFGRWEGQWYTDISPEPFVDLIKPGTVIVIDASGNGDTGTIGSHNSLAWHARGACGIVTTGSLRDTDEVTKQKIPVYVDPLARGRGIRPGRNMVESVNRPVEVGGALVRPGDIVVADGDGVVVVPREHAAPVARAARAILESDKAGRRALYQRLGRPLDRTVSEQTAAPNPCRKR
jgi:4-hydroxy-4-methyl-2-oxoglutarate aldolase